MFMKTVQLEELEQKKAICTIAWEVYLLVLQKHLYKDGETEKILFPHQLTEDKLKNL